MTQVKAVVFDSDGCRVDPHEAIMVGNSVVDILTGKRAGAFAAIGVAHGCGSSEDLRNAGADYILEGLPAVENMIFSLMAQGNMARSNPFV